MSNPEDDFARSVRSGDEAEIDRALRRLFPPLRAVADHPAGHDASASPKGAPVDRVPPWLGQVLVGMLASAAIDALAVRALTRLTGQLAQLGAPVPALTRRQARRLWHPASLLISIVALRAGVARKAVAR